MKQTNYLFSAVILLAAMLVGSGTMLAQTYQTTNSPFHWCEFVHFDSSKASTAQSTSNMFALRPTNNDTSKTMNIEHLEPGDTTIVLVVVPYSPSYETIDSVDITVNVWMYTLGSLDTVVSIRWNSLGATYKPIHVPLHTSFKGGIASAIRVNVVQEALNCPTNPNYEYVKVAIYWRENPAYGLLREPGGDAGPLYGLLVPSRVPDVPWDYPLVSFNDQSPQPGAY